MSAKTYEDLVPRAVYILQMVKRYHKLVMDKNNNVSLEFDDRFANMLATELLDIHNNGYDERCTAFSKKS